MGHSDASAEVFRAGGLAIVSVCALACVGYGDAAPSTGSPTGSSPDAITEVQIHIVGGYLKVGRTRGATSTVRLASGRTMAVLPSWESTNPSIFTVDANGVMTGVAAGLARIRATYQGASNTIQIRVVSVNPPPGKGASPAGPSVVVSELRSSGMLGPNDEFVEIQNVSSEPIDISGYSLAIAGASEPASSGNIPRGVVLEPGCFYLFAGAGENSYSGGDIAIPDFLYDASLLDDGGVALVDRSAQIVDQVGLGAGAFYVEGRPISNAGGSYQRTGVDSNDNVSDFVLLPLAEPANRQSPCRR